MKYLSWIWTDGKTSKFSSTTLRTWILFFLFIALCIYLVFVDSIITSEDISVLQLVGMANFGQGALYLGKRVTDKEKKIKFRAREFEGDDFQ